MATSEKRVLSSGKLIFERTSFLNDKEKHAEWIYNHGFNSSVEIFLPQLADVPKAIGNIIDQQFDFYVKHVTLQLLTSLDFIKGFIQGGSLCMLSYGTRVDTDDCVAVTPAVVKVDLMSEDFYPGMKCYDRVKWCLTQMKKLDFLLTWLPNDANVCPSSIQSYFLSQSVQCSLVKTSNSTHQFKNFKIPKIDAEVVSPEGNDKSCSYDKVFEWLGACAVGIDRYEGDGYVTTYNCPDPKNEVSCCVHVQYNRIVHPLTIQDLLTFLRKIVQEKRLPFCALTVHGFVDSPMSWLQDHAFFNYEDNIYSILMFPNDDYWLYSAIGRNDICL